MKNIESSIKKIRTIIATDCVTQNHRIKCKEIVDLTNEIIAELRQLWLNSEFDLAKKYIMDMMKVEDNYFLIFPSEGQIISNYIFEKAKKWGNGDVDLTIYQQFYLANLSMLIDFSKIQNEMEENGLLY